MALLSSPASFARIAWLIGALGCALPCAQAATGPEYLAAQQQANGGLATTPASLATDVQASAEAIRAFQILGLSSDPFVTAGIAFLNNQSESNTEYLARKIIVNATAGNNVSALIAELLTHQNADGGFGDRTGHQSSILDTAFALDALSHANQIGTPVASAVGFLLDQQQTNGGWINGDNEASTYLTSTVFRALWQIRHRYAGVLAALENAKLFLLSRRDASQSWGETFDSALALAVLVPYLPDLGVVSDSLSGLQSAQLANGSWENDPYTTALAMQALYLATLPQSNPDHATIKGRVVDAETGLGLDGTVVALSGPTLRTIGSDTDGSFRFESLAAGRYTVAFSLANYASFTTTTTANHGQTIDLGLIPLKKATGSSTATITGTVRDASTGSPLAGVAVGASGIPSPVFTNSNGSYLISNVPAGTVTVVASLAGYTTASLTAQLAADGTLLFSPSLHQGNSQDTAVLTGTIRHGVSGVPLAGVSIVAIGDRISTSGITDASGSYRIEDVRAGVYSLSASLVSFDTVTVQANVFQGSTVTFSPRLYPTNNSPPNANTASVIGIVVDASSGLALPGARVEVAFGGNSRNLITDGSGRFTVTGLTAAEGSLLIAHDGYQSRFLLVTVQPIDVLDLGSIRLLQQGVDQVLPDLVITKVNGSAVHTDPVSLSVNGVVSVTVKNGGYASAKSGVALLAFYDANANGSYDSTTDTLLGQGATIAELGINTEQSIEIAVGGMLPFRDAPISVWVDSGQVVAETSETNNVASTAAGCTVAASRRKHYAYNASDAGKLLVTGYADNSAYTLRPLPQGQVITGTVNRMQRKEIALTGIRHFLVETDTPMLAVTGNKTGAPPWGVYCGSLFYPAINGQSWYGREFIVSPNCVSSVSQTVVFAHEPAVVTITNAAGNIVETSPLLPATGVWRPIRLVAEGIYRFSSTGLIAIANNSGNAYTQVPPVPVSGQPTDFHNDVGTDFYFATYAWGFGGTGDVAVMNAGPGPAEFSIRNLVTGAFVVTNLTLPAGAVYFKDNMGTAYYHLHATSGRVAMWAGDNEGGQSIAFIGDDISLNAGELGKKFVLHTQSLGGFIYASDDQTEVSINSGQPTVLNQNEFLSLAPGQVVSITSTKPVLVQIMGGNVINDWAATLRPLFGPPAPGADLTASRLKLIDNGAGQLLSIELRVGNAGAAASPNSIDIAFYEGDPLTGGVSLGTVKPGSLAPGAYQDVRFDGLASNGQADVFAVVDAGNVVLECNESNNVAQSPVIASPLGHLSVATDAVSYGPNSYVQIQTTVTNTGALTSDFNVLLQIEDSSGVVVTTFASQLVSALISGVSHGLSTTWNTGTLLSGTYRVHAFLSAPDGTLLREAFSNFEIRHSDVPGAAAVTLRTTTERPVYHTTDLVEIQNLVVNVSANTLIDGASLRVTIKDPAGQVIFTQTGALGQLVPGSLRDLLLPYTLSAASVAVYQVLGEVLAADQSVLASSSAQIEVKGDLAKSLSGTTTVAATELDIGATQTCTDTVKNVGTLTIGALTVHHTLVNIDAGTQVSNAPEQIALAVGEQKENIRSFSTSGLTAGNYACVLRAEIDGALTTLSFAPFVLVQPPVSLELTIKAQGKGRLLVLLDGGGCARDSDKDDDKDKDGDKDKDDDKDKDHDRGCVPGAGNDTDPHGPSGAPLLSAQRAFLEKLLSDHGWSYAITTSANDFTHELRTGNYNTYALLAEQEKLSEQAQKELREAAFRGEGLIVAGIHESAIAPSLARGPRLDPIGDNRGHKLIDALGIKLIGAVSQVSGVNLTASDLGLSGPFAVIPGDKALRIKRTTAVSAAQYQAAQPGKKSGSDDCRHEDDDDDHSSKSKSSSKKDDHDECEGQPEKYLDAVTLNAYGKGKSAFAGIDLLATATKDGETSLAAKTLLSLLDHVAPSTTSRLPGAVVPLTVTVKNLGIATPATVLITLPDGMTALDAPGGEIAGPVVAFNIDSLAAGAEKTFALWVKLPQDAGTARILGSVLVPAQTAPIADTSIDLIIEATVDLATIKAKLQGHIQTGHPEAQAFKQARDALDKAIGANSHEKRIDYALKAADKLSDTTSPQAIDIRCLLGAWLKGALPDLNQTPPKPGGGKSGD